MTHEQRSVQLTDEQWAKVHDFLRQAPGIYVGDEAECRRFLETVLWLVRSGAPWRLLPGEYGRWCEPGVWTKMHQHFVQDPDLESLLLDSPIIRAHPAAAGAPAKKGGNSSRR
jgi:transposase